MTRYAASTQVTAEKSRAEIERNLRRYGATQFGYGWDDENGSALIAFRAHDRHIRFVLPMPDRNAREFTHTPAGRQKRDADSALAAWEQGCRQRWRALNLSILAKLEATEAGISTFEAEFASWVVLPNGQTVGEWLGPQIELAYDTQNMPSLMPGLGELPRGDS